MCASEFIHTILYRNLFRYMGFHAMMQFYTYKKLLALEIIKINIFSAS